RDLLPQLELDLRRVGCGHSLTANVYGAQGPCMTVVTSPSCAPRRSRRERSPSISSRLTKADIETATAGRGQIRCRMLSGSIASPLSKRATIASARRPTPPRGPRCAFPTRYADRGPRRRRRPPPRRWREAAGSYVGSVSPDRIDARKHHAESEVNEIDAGDGDRHLSGEHDAAIQQTVDQLDQRDVQRRGLLGHDIPPKRYAGHGPLARTR